MLNVVLVKFDSDVTKKNGGSIIELDQLIEILQQKRKDENAYECPFTLQQFHRYTSFRVVVTILTYSYELRS